MAKKQQGPRFVQLTQKQIYERDTCLLCPLPDCVGEKDSKCKLFVGDVHPRRRVEKKMVWVEIRPAEPKDYLKLDKKAHAFIGRYSLDGVQASDEFMAKALENWLKENSQEPRVKQLKKLWVRIVRNALKDKRADGIVEGTVGFMAKEKEG